jgi:hypothetical protein
MVTIADGLSGAGHLAADADVFVKVCETYSAEAR